MEFHTVRQLLLQALDMLDGTNPGYSPAELRIGTVGAMCLATGMLDRARPADWIGSRLRTELIYTLQVEADKFWSERLPRRALVAGHAIA